MKKVSASKLSESLNNVANNLNNNVRRVVKNEMAINLVRVLIIVYTSFVIPMLDSNTLALLNNNVVRLVVCALIVYLSFMDVITAVLLTIAFVLTLHQGSKKVQVVNNNVIRDVEVNQAENDFVNKINNLTNVKVENYEDLSEAIRNNAPSATNHVEVNTNVPVNAGANNANAGANNENAGANNANAGANNVNVGANNANDVANNVANQVLNNALPNAENNLGSVPVGMDTSAEAGLAVFNNNAPENVVAPARDMPIDEVNNMHPASSTMTDNILAAGTEFDVNGPAGLTTSQHLYAASENAVPGADIMNQVVSVEGGLSAQGMNHPIGSNHPRHDGYHYVDGANLTHHALRNNAVKN